jgi:hypothetical protein
MTAMECFLYTAILANADPSTGIWHSSAGCLAALYSISPRTCRDSLERLEKGGYLKRFPIRGKHGQYPILVHRFDCSDGAMKGMRLNAMESLSWETPIYESCDEGAATVPERGRGECRSERDDGATKYLETRDYETREEQKPSAKDKPSPDPRALDFRHDFEVAYRHINGIPAPWDGKEAANLKRWLAKNPTITREQWQAILKHRRASPINQKAELSRWISSALSWLDSTADEWGKPINGGKQNGTGNSILSALAESLAEDQDGFGSDGDDARGGEGGRIASQFILEASRKRAV